MDASTAWEQVFEKINLVMGYKLFEINQTPISPSSFLMFALVIVGFMVASRIVNRGLLGRVLGRFQIESSLQYTIIRIGHYLVMIIGGVVAFQFVGIDLSGLAVIFGLLSVGIGFGLQNVTSNFVAGLILLFERPIKVGDRVVVGETEGDVVDINMRATTIRSLSNITIIVPNSEFVSNNVVNWSHGDPKVRLDLDVGVSYDSDLDLVLNTLREVAEEHQEIISRPQPDVLLAEFGDSSWNMKLRVWIANPQRHYITRSELNCSIVRKFRERGIEIPFPQRDLHLRSPLPLPVGQEMRKTGS